MSAPCLNAPAERTCWCPLHDVVILAGAVVCPRAAAAPVLIPPAHFLRLAQWLSRERHIDGAARAYPGPSAAVPSVFTEMRRTNWSRFLSETMEVVS